MSRDMTQIEKKTKQQKNWGVFFWALFFKNARYWFCRVFVDAPPVVGGRTVSCGLQGGVVLCFFDRSSYLRLNIQKIASRFIISSGINCYSTFGTHA